MGKHNVTRGIDVVYQSSPDASRADLTIQSSADVEVFVRQAFCADVEQSLVPVILIHGARAPVIASFDLDVPDGSLAADLARAGHPVFLMDARGFGGSTRPPAMVAPPDHNLPLTRSSEVVNDIAAVVEHVIREIEQPQVAVMGWATGSQWLAHYASVAPERVSHVVLYNAVWPVAASWPLGDDYEDPTRPGELRDGALAAYGFATAEALIARWDASIPCEDKDYWRDPGLTDCYVKTALGSDPTAGERTPPSFRAPLGPHVDTFYLTRGRKLFDPAQITSRVLVLRSERDFWTREIDAEAPVRDLTSAAAVERVILAGATHYAHLDRPDRGRNQLLSALLQFLERH